MRIRILPYKMISLGAIHLTKALAGKMIFPDKQTFKPDKEDFIINWGNTTEYAQWVSSRVKVFLNNPQAVQRAVNKVSFYELCTEAKLPCPRWTKDREEANTWAKNHTVVARTLLEASQGRGIILVNPGEPCPPARVYTLYHPKRSEFRVHVFRGTVVDVQQKRVRDGVEKPNYQIRSYDNGFVYCRENVKAPNAVLEASLNVFKASGLDFGAVDVGYSEGKDRAIVYEINTAPGLEGTTLEVYTDQLKKIIKAVYGTDKVSLRSVQEHHDGDRGSKGKRRLG